MTSEPSRNPDYKEQKAAIRSYLQRCEVRLSTMHRIAGLFLNGAGLLILFPILFKDVFINDFFWSVNKVSDPKEIPVVFFISILCSVIVSFTLSVYSLYNLLREIALFYFMPHVIRFYDDKNPESDDKKSESRDNLFHPRFTVSAIAFPLDESGLEKSVEEISGKEISGKEISEDSEYFVPKNIRKARENSNLYGVLLPDDDKKWHLQEVLKDDARIIPPRRRNWKAKIELSEIQPEDYYNAQFGLAGGSDLRLIEEAAQMEASLIRNSIFLRRLVLRYLKSFLVLGWTVFIEFIVSHFLNEKGFDGKDLIDKTKYFSNVCYALITYMIWFLLTPGIVKIPIQWIQSHAEKGASSRDHYRDPDLVKFEELVRKSCGFICLVIAGLLVTSYKVQSVGVSLSLAFIFVGLFLLFRWDEQVFQTKTGNRSKTKS